MPTLREMLEETGQEKVASYGQQQENRGDSMSKIASDLGIFNELFPEDAHIGQGQTKVAEEEKIAAYQEALGARAYDYFTHRFNERMEKIAAEVMDAAGMEQAQAILQPSARPQQAIPSNQDPLGDKVPASPATAVTPYSLLGGMEAGAEGQVGHEEQQKVAEVSGKLLAALGLGAAGTLGGIGAGIGHLAESSRKLDAARRGIEDNPETIIQKYPKLTGAASLGLLPVASGEYTRVERDEASPKVRELLKQRPISARLVR